MATGAAKAAVDEVPAPGHGTLHRHGLEVNARQLSCHDATAFAQVNQTLTPEQRGTLAALRGLPGYVSAPACIDSRPVQDVVRLPGTDFFFFPELAPGGCGVMTTPSARRR